MSNQRRPISDSSESISTASKRVPGNSRPYARAVVPAAFPSIATRRGARSRTANGSTRYSSQ